MNDFGEANADVVIMWSQVRAYTNMTPYYVILIIAIMAVPAYLIYLLYQKKKENRLEKMINNQ